MFEVSDTQSMSSLSPGPSPSVVFTACCALNFLLRGICVTQTSRAPAAMLSSSNLCVHTLYGCRNRDWIDWFRADVSSPWFVYPQGLFCLPVPSSCSHASTCLIETRNMSAVCMPMRWMGSGFRLDGLGRGACVRPLVSRLMCAMVWHLCNARGCKEAGNVQNPTAIFFLRVSVAYVRASVLTAHMCTRHPRPNPPGVILLFDSVHLAMVRQHGRLRCVSL